MPHRKLHNRGVRQKTFSEIVCAKKVQYPLTHIELHSSLSFSLYSFDGFPTFANNKTNNISRNWNLHVPKKVKSLFYNVLSEDGQYPEKNLFSRGVWGYYLHLTLYSLLDLKKAFSCKKWISNTLWNETCNTSCLLYAQSTTGLTTDII